MKRNKKLIMGTIWLTVFAVIELWLCYASISWNALGRVYDDVADVPPHEYAIILGTSPITTKGAHNFYFDNRIKAAVELYRVGKVRKFIVSGGDYSRDENGDFTKYGCDELRAMTDSLTAHGVPYEVITRDYDGTRTLNSIVKVKEKYGLDSVIIISQKYHNERAIAQADHYGLKAIGYNAAHSHILQNRVKNILREVCARPKMYLDLLFGKKPVFTKTNVINLGRRFEEWRTESQNIEGMDVVGWLCNADSSWGFYKYYTMHSDTPFYYNSRHGYHVLLPKGFGIRQSGENMMGAHGNEFYNNDTTLVISSYAIYYDAVLVDEPHITDTLRRDEKKRIIELSPSAKIRESGDTIWAEGRIDHSSPENPPADRFLSKFLLKKDIENRETHQEIIIYFSDSLTYKEAELREIINKFPDNPFK